MHSLGTLSGVGRTRQLIRKHENERWRDPDLEKHDNELQSCDLIELRLGELCIYLCARFANGCTMHDRTPIKLL